MELHRAALAIACVPLALLVPGCRPNRGAETVPCPPGASVWVGCNQACALGSCTGNPALIVCDGSTPVARCDDDTAIATNDDPETICFSTCPIVQLTCPASGRVTVVQRPGSRSPNTCDWRIEERPPSRPDGGSDASASTADASTADAGDADGGDA